MYIYILYIYFTENVKDNCTIVTPVVKILTKILTKSDTTNMRLECVFFNNRPDGVLIGLKNNLTGHQQG